MLTRLVLILLLVSSSAVAGYDTGGTSGGAGGVTSVTYLWAPWAPATDASVVISGSADLMRCVRFVPEKSIAATKISFQVTTLAASSFTGAAIYNDGDAGAQVCTSGAKDTASAGSKTTTGLACTLTAGTAYKVCACSSSTTVAIAGRSANNRSEALLNAIVASYGTAANNCTTGAPAATTGAITAAGNVNSPYVLLSAE